MDATRWSADRLMRVVVPATLALGATYLGWRVLYTREGTNAFLFWRLWSAELMVWISFAAAAWEGWTLQSQRRRPITGDPAVDVVVVCRDEPLEVLLATLVGCTEVHGRHRTVAVDTVGRSDLATACAPLEVDLLSPADLGLAGLDPVAALAQVLPAVMPLLDNPLFTVLDGDHVPLPGMLDELVGDFEDPAVWLAQGRHATYGPSSQDYVPGAGELEYFFAVRMAGKASHGGTYWCGPGGVVRRAAVAAVGGVPVTTDTPEFQLSLAAARHGWRSTYHNRPVVMALAAPCIDTYVATRSLLAHGHLQSLRTRHSPLTASGFPPAVRLSYLSSLLSYLNGPRRFAVVWIVCATLLTGALPVRAAPLELLLAWGTWTLALSWSRRLLSRGVAGRAATNNHRWLLIGAYESAWLGLLVPRRVVHALREPVPAVGSSRQPVLRLRLLNACIAALTLSVLTRSAAQLGWLAMPALHPVAAACAILAATALLVALGTTLAGTARRARRRSPRFAVEATALVGSRTHRVLDLAQGGASVRFDRPPSVGQAYVLALRIPGLDGGIHKATVAAEVRSVRRIAGSAGSGWAVGVAFTHMSTIARRRITEYCRVLLPARIAATVAGDDRHRPTAPPVAAIAPAGSARRAG